MTTITNNKECNNCGAEYSISYDEDQFGIGEEEPKFCCFCSNEISDYFYEEDDMQELDFEDE
jgi:hypothetical protein